MKMLSLLRRELRAREMQVFLLSLVISTAAITAPALLGERLSGGVRSYSADILGGDLRLRSPTPLAEDLFSSQLEQARTLSTSSMIYAAKNDRFQLARLKAISSNYPLRGAIITKQGADERTDGQLKRGEIWLDELLADLLDVSLGEEVVAGEASFRFSAYLIDEPSASFFSFAPRAMINMADLAATRLVLPGSRLSYSYLWRGEQNEVSQFANQIRPQLEANQQLISSGDDNENFTDMLSRLKSFLMLSGSLSVILAAFALVLTIRFYLTVNSRYIALLKTLGYTPMQALGYLCRRLGILALVAYLSGCAIGWLVYQLIGSLLEDYLPAAENASYWFAYLLSGLSVLLCLIAFALPSIIEMARIAPIAVLRPQTRQTQREWLLGTIVFIGLLGLVLLYSRNWIVALSLTLGLLGILLVISLFSYSLLRLLYLNAARLGMSWKIAMASLYRNWRLNSLQILAFTMALMLLGILLVLRISFITDLQQQVAPGTPNNFLINIAPSEVAPLQDFFHSHQVAAVPFAGMVRGKLMKVDGESLVARTKRLGTYSSEAEREFNLGWSKSLPSHNELAAGSWWDESSLADDSVQPISVEDELAEEFDIRLGHQLEFLIGGRTLYGRVVNLRTLNWADFKPNFYVLFPPNALQDFPRTYMTSFYLPETKNYFATELVRRFPTQSLISVDIILKRVTAIFNLVTNAMQLILLLSLVAALAVFLATVQVSIRSRAITTATLRLIGETNQQAIIHNLLEFGFLGLMAGILAAVGTETVVFFTYIYLLEQDPSFHAYLWILAPVCGAALTSICGFFWSRRAVIIPPQQLLRANL